MTPDTTTACVTGVASVPSGHQSDPRTIEADRKSIERARRLVTPLLRAHNALTRRFANTVLLAAAETLLALPTHVGPDATSVLTPRQLRRAQGYMIDNLSRKIAIRDVATACGLSPSHFTRAFRSSCGDTPHQWLLKQRMERAKQLLRENKLCLSQIGLECGFSHRVSFTKAFSRIIGTSPAHWRYDNGEEVDKCAAA
jgi:transcriptional regulator GlxA family with amidase domain